MSLFTSTHFASACASGTDWRDTSKAVLEKLESIKESPDFLNFGFLYISDHLAEDATSIFNLFRSVIKIDNWVGSVGMGVIGCAEAYIDKPAISAMVCKFPADSFCVFPKKNEDDSSEKTDKSMETWLHKNMPLLTLVHADPMAEEDPQELIRDLEQATNSFIIGGVTSSRSQHYQIANTVLHNSVSGAFFSEGVQVSTTLSQGCEPISDYHTITKSDEITLLSLNDNRALDVLQDDLRAYSSAKTGKKSEDFSQGFRSIEASDQIPEELKVFFKGQVHAALPLSQSDQNDFLVRNIIGIDVDEGSVSISDHVSTGNKVLFVARDQDTIASDLTKTLINLRKRVEQERGSFNPKGALYVSCIARGFDQLPEGHKHEIDIINEIIGDIPLTGFYAGGEINNARLYGYTGVLTLFF